MTEVPRNLRRSANRGAGPQGKAPSPRLLAAADAGVLTRRNTISGSAGRKAVDRSVYTRRRSVEPDLSAREALGHRVAGSRPRKATFFTTDPPRRITVSDSTVTLRDVHRAGHYIKTNVGGLLRDLARASGNAARVARVKRSWERRMRARAPIAGLPVLADADAAIALAEQLREEGSDAITFDSGRSRPGRRRRSTARRRR